MRGNVGDAAMAAHQLQVVQQELAAEKAEWDKPNLTLARHPDPDTEPFSIYFGGQPSSAHGSIRPFYPHPHSTAPSELFSMCSAIIYYADFPNTYPNPNPNTL